jgi:alanine racemase
MIKRVIAEIDLNSIKNNINELKKLAHENTKFLLPVKANAYGHGIIEVSKFVEKNNLIDMLGVASINEGIELRKSGIITPILIFGLIDNNRAHLKKIFDYNLTPTVADINIAEEISDMGKKLERKIPLHLKIDTGMGRIGCSSINAVEIAAEINKLKNIDFQGIYSHFPVADEEKNSSIKFTRDQINKFDDIIHELDSKKINIPIKHLANSAGIINFPESAYNMIRPGIAVYGYAPSDKKEKIKLEPVMAFKSNIIFIKKVKKGIPLSYGLTFTTKKDTNIATISVGYGDGYARSLSNKGFVIIKNKKYPVVGRVTMDQILIDIGTDIYGIGEEVILFGKENITANSIAELTDTISYEVTCDISVRVPRIYI